MDFPSPAATRITTRHVTRPADADVELSHQGVSVRRGKPWKARAPVTAARPAWELEITRAIRELEEPDVLESVVALGGFDPLPMNMVRAIAARRWRRLRHGYSRTLPGAVSG